MKNIKICHVTSLHSADDPRIFHKECCSLAKCYEVFLIAPNVRDYIKDGVRVFGVSLPSNRLIRTFRLSRIYNRAIIINADVYHFHDPELIPIGLKIKKMGKKVIFDSHEDIPMQILTKEWIPKVLRRPLSMLYALYEKRKLKQYDALVTVTPTITERLEKINHNTFQITNYPESKNFVDQRQWKKKICFTGGISEKYMHHVILEAVKDLDLTYVMAGPCAPESYMKQLRALDGWKKVDYRGIVKREECNAIMQECSIGVAILDYLPNVGYKKGTLGVLKIFEYMQAGIPVIATDFDIWKDIIEGNNCGICVNPHDVKSIIKSISYILSNPQKAKEMGENGRALVEHNFTWNTQEKILFNLYNQIA